MRKQKKRAAVVTVKKGKKPKTVRPVESTVKDGLPGEEDVLLDQVATKPHPEYPDFE